MIKKKIKKKIIMALAPVVLIGAVVIVIVCALVTLDFFGTNETDGYVEENEAYAEDYKNVLNQNIKYGNGYVSLSRILYFYLEDDQLSFSMIYSDNLDKETKKQKPISEVCEMPRYKSMSVCKTEELSDSSQSDEDVIKPFTAPLKISNMNVTSFFMEQRTVYGKFDVHEAWDLSSPNNTLVYSTCDGEVIQVKFPYSENKIDTSGGGGNQIKIKCEVDEDTTYEVWYAHLYPKSSKVKEGDKVKQWQQIAEVGTTGYSTGPHLHYQVSKDGSTVDGMSLIDFTDTNSETFVKPPLEPYNGLNPNLNGNYPNFNGYTPYQP